MFARKLGMKNDLSDSSIAALEALETFWSLVISSSGARWIPADLYARLGKNLIHAEVLLGSTAAANCLASFAGFRAQASQASSRLFNFLDNISARPSFFSKLLAAVLRITTFISKSPPDWELSFTRIDRERSILSVHFRIHSKTGTMKKPQLFVEVQNMNGPVSGRSQINPEHSQGQLARQKAQRCTGLSGGKVEWSRSRKNKSVHWQNGWGYSSCRRHDRDSISIMCQAYAHLEDYVAAET